jgi:hypothetical protein
MPISQLRSYELDGETINIKRFFEVNDFTYNQKREVLGMETGDTITLGEDEHSLKRID